MPHDKPVGAETWQRILGTFPPTSTGPVWRASEFRLRDQGCCAPVLMLTARGDLAARVRGLDSGADDYLVKPFSFDELFARLRPWSAPPVRLPADVPYIGEKFYRIRRTC